MSSWRTCNEFPLLMRQRPEFVAHVHCLLVDFDVVDGVDVVVVGMMMDDQM